MFSIDAATEILANTPATLRCLLDDLSDQWLHADEGPETFSPFDVVGHLIHGEKTDWIPRAHI
ncbi:MAG: DinB family protein, partial [bacterium]